MDLRIPLKRVSCVVPHPSPNSASPNAFQSISVSMKKMLQVFLAHKMIQILKLMSKLSLASTTTAYSAKGEKVC